MYYNPDGAFLGLLEPGKSDWYDPAGVNYKSNGLDVNISGGKQIVMDTVALQSSVNQINEAVSQMAACCHSLTNAASNLRVICAALGQYLEGQWAQITGKLEQQVHQGLKLQSLWKNLLDRINLAIEQYQKMEDLLKYYDLKLPDTLMMQILFPASKCEGGRKSVLKCEDGRLLFLNQTKKMQTRDGAAFSAYQLMKMLHEVPRKTEQGEIRVLKNETNGKTSWTVLVPGTQVWFPYSKNPQDLSTNLRMVSGSKNDMTALVARSLMMSGYKTGEPVELVGHSQGGAVAYRFAADKQLQKKFNVQSVLTVGSNIGAGKPQGTSRVLALENGRDVVPWAVTQGNYQSNRLTRVIAHHPDEALLRYTGNITKDVRRTIHYLNNPFDYAYDQHSHERYLKTAKALDNINDPSYNNWEKHRENALHLGTGTKTTRFDYQLHRGR